jgi:sugar O-acyltransferase (sialic acid O-acetyltransferase NeuD family)
MSRPLVIFGAGPFAELACHYFTDDSEFEVAAFAVDAQFLTQTTLCDRPVMPFEEIATSHPPSEYALFVAVGYAQLNALRKEKFDAAKSLGYQLVTYVNSRATVMPSASLGENCFVFEAAVVQPFAAIGDNVTLWSGSHVGHHSSVGDHSFLAPQACVPGNVRIGEQCFVGTNATLRDGITVGERCVVGAGAVLLSDAEPDGLYVGAETHRAGIPASKITTL